MSFKTVGSLAPEDVVAAAILDSGYAVIPSAVDSELAIALERAVGSESAGGYEPEGPNSLVHRSALEIAGVVDLLDIPLLGALADRLLFRQGYVLSATVRRVLPGAPRQNLHTDFPPDWPPSPSSASLFSAYPLLIAAHYPGGLDDELGAFWVRPGSQVGGITRTEPEVSVLPGPRDLLVFDARVLHGGGANNTLDRTRRGIFVDIAPSYIRRPHELRVSGAPKTSVGIRLLDDSLRR